MKKTTLVNLYISVLNLDTVRNPDFKGTQEISTGNINGLRISDETQKRVGIAKNGNVNNQKSRKVTII